MWLAEINSFGDFLEMIDSDELIAFFAIATTFSSAVLITLIVVVGRTIRSVRLAKSAEHTIQAMADRGYSATEIERVVRAARFGGIQLNLGPREKDLQSAFAPPPKPAKVST